MVGKEIRRVGRGYHYFFVKPSNGDAHKTAERLMTINSVREVSITEGEYGFVVKADIMPDRESKVLTEISKAAKGKSTKAICHYLYIK